MTRPRQTVLTIVPPAEVPRDLLARSLDELAISMASDLKGSGFDIHEKTEALKALTAYFAATRGKGTGAPPPPEDAFDAYRKAQSAT
jgi:hypothetical protein